MSTLPIGSGPESSDGETELGRRYSRRMILTTIGLAAGLVGGTWYIGERKGYSSIGSGGANTNLLPKVGEPAPDLVALLSENELVFLSDFLGQPVWLNFWGSWCQPCRAEMPAMQAAYERLAPRGLVILAVALDEPLENALDYAALQGATYIVAGDPVRKGSGANYGIANFPTHILIDRAGIIREIILATLEEDEFVEHAEKILALETTR